MSVSLGRLSDNVWLFATASHSFDGAGKSLIYVRCKGKWAPAQFISRNKRHDIALLRVQHSGDLKCAPLADGAAYGDSVHFVRLRGKRASGTVRSSTGLSGVQPVQGDSGSPIYNNDGEVVGLVRGYINRGSTFYTSASRIRSYILAKVGRLPVCGTADVAPNPPAPPKEKPPVPVETHDHVNILRRIAALEKDTADISVEIKAILATTERINRKLTLLEELIEGLPRPKRGPIGPKGEDGPRGLPGERSPGGTISEQRITAIIEKMVAEKFRKVSGELNIRVQPGNRKRK